MNEKERRDITDPFLKYRLQLEHMRDGLINMEGEDLYAILKKMYTAKLLKTHFAIDPEVDNSGEFTFPGSRGPVIIEHVDGTYTRKEWDAYNVTYTDSSGDQRKIGTVAAVTWRHSSAGVGRFSDIADVAPRFYTGSIDSLCAPHGQKVKAELSGELLTALNYLHKPTRGQRQRSQRRNA